MFFKHTWFLHEWDIGQKLIKDTDYFLKNLPSLSKLRGDVVLCTVDVAGLYPNIPHEEGLPALRKRLDNWKEKYISSDMLCNLPKVAPKSNIIKFCRKVFKQKRRTVIGTNLYLHIVISSWQNWKKEFLGKQNWKLIYSGSILMIHFSFGNMEKRN